jgi:glycosyltransferase involved in cell wall biosynthesis
MKILQIINGLNIGGAETLISNMIPLMKDNHEIDLLILTIKDAVYFEELSKYVKIYVSPYNKPRSLSNINYIKKIIKNGNYDIVHSHLFPSLYWTIFSKKKCNSKFVFTEHSTSNKRRTKWYFRYIDKFIYSKYDKIIAISDGVKQSLINWIGKSHLKKIQVINNGIPLEKFKEAKAYSKRDLHENIDENDYVVMMVARFSHQKDQMTLIKAVEQLPKNIHCVFVGDGKFKEKHVQYVIENNIIDQIHFLGNRNDVPSLIKTSDIFVLSSYWEGFGLTAVEAMTLGKPVIASNVPGLNEVVSKYGILFEVGDVLELKSAIINLLENNKLYKDYQQLSLIRSEKYSIDKMVNDYIELYEALKYEK